PLPPSSLFPFTTLFRSWHSGCPTLFNRGCSVESFRRWASQGFSNYTTRGSIWGEHKVTRKPSATNVSNETNATDDTTRGGSHERSEEHTSELQSRVDLV